MYICRFQKPINVHLQEYCCQLLRQVTDNEPPTSHFEYQRAGENSNDDDAPQAPKSLL